MRFLELFRFIDIDSRHWVVKANLVNSPPVSVEVVGIVCWLSWFTFSVWVSKPITWRLPEKALSQRQANMAQTCDADYSIF